MEVNKKSGRTRQPIHISLPEEKALSLLLKLKPTADMPRQGTHPDKPKKAKQQSQ